MANRAVDWYHYFVVNNNVVITVLWWCVVLCLSCQFEYCLQGPVYQAMYDYDAQDDDEVGFRENDIVVNVEPIDEGWMFGTIERTGMRGMLPANYVERIQWWHTYHSLCILSSVYGRLKMRENRESKGSWKRVIENCGMANAGSIAPPVKMLAEKYGSEIWLAQQVEIPYVPPTL